MTPREIRRLKKETSRGISRFGGTRFGKEVPNNGGSGSNLDPGLTFAVDFSNGTTPSSGPPTPWTYTRATTATVTDFEGLIKSCLSGELRIQGARRVQNFDTNTQNSAAWAATNVTLTTGVSDPLGGTAAVTATATAGSDTAFTYSIGSSASRLFQNSVYLKRRTGTGTVKIRNAANGGTVDIASSLSTSEWKRFSVGAVTVVNPFSFVVLFGTSGDAVDIAFPQVEDVTGQSNQNPSEYVSVGVLSSPYHGYFVDGVKYFSYENGNTVASNVVTEAQGSAISTTIGYLAEGARTNLALKAENIADLATWPNIAGITSHTNNIYVAPTGATTMARITLAAGNTEHQFYQGSLTVTSQAYTYSAYARYDNHRWLALAVSDGTKKWASFDLLNGVVGTTTAGVTSTIETTGLANVYRISMTLTLAATASANIYVVANSSDSASDQTWNAAGTELFGFFGAQLEATSFASTYIPTTTAAVARNQDTLYCPHAGLISDAEGTVYVEAIVPWTTQELAGAGVAFVGFGGATQVSPIVSFYTYPATSIGSYDGTTNLFLASQPSLATGVRKMAQTWGGSARTIAHSGNTNTGTYDGSWGMTGVYIGVGGGSTLLDPPNCVIPRVKLYRKALSVAQIASLTS